MTLLFKHSYTYIKNKHCQRDFFALLRNAYLFYMTHTSLKARFVIYCSKKKRVVLMFLPNGNELPQDIIDNLAKMMLPEIQKFYESEEGNAIFDEWKRNQKAVSKQDE